MREVAEVKEKGFVLSGDAEEKHTLKNLNRFLSLVGAQDDRAMVLSLATFIEDTLGRLLIAYFRDCKATWSKPTLLRQVSKNLTSFWVNRTALQRPGLHWQKFNTSN